MIPLRWNAAIIGSGALLAAALALWLYIGHLRSEVALQRARAVAAEAQAAMRSVETKVTENYHHDTKIIRETVEKEADAVEQIPSSDVPADVLSAWRAGLRNVTNSAAADHDTTKPAR